MRELPHHSGEARDTYRSDLFRRMHIRVRVDAAKTCAWEVNAECSSASALAPHAATYWEAGTLKPGSLVGPSRLLLSRLYGATDSALA